MNAIKILAETKDTVTVSREDLKRLMAALEDAEDRAAVAEYDHVVPDLEGCLGDRRYANRRLIERHGSLCPD